MNKIGLVFKPGDRPKTNNNYLPGQGIVLHVRRILLLSMFFCIPPPQDKVHFVHSGSPGQRLVLQALVIVVLFRQVTCIPPPHVFVHSVQQVLLFDAAVTFPMTLHSWSKIGRRNVKSVIMVKHFTNSSLFNTKIASLTPCWFNRRYLEFVCAQTSS